MTVTDPLPGLTEPTTGTTTVTSYTLSPSASLGDSKLALRPEVKSTAKLTLVHRSVSTEPLEASAPSSVQLRCHRRCCQWQPCLQDRSRTPKVIAPGAIGTRKSISRPFSDSCRLQATDTALIRSIRPGNCPVPRPRSAGGLITAPEPDAPDGSVAVTTTVYSTMSSVARTLVALSKVGVSPSGLLEVQLHPSGSTRRYPKSLVSEPNHPNQARCRCLGIVRRVPSVFSNTSSERRWLSASPALRPSVARRS